MRQSPRWLDPLALDFPDPGQALVEPNGLLALGGDLAPKRIIEAYRRGIFPWYEDPQPIMWWSPNPRAVLFPDKFHLSRSLRKTVKSGQFSASVDRYFPAVIHNCGRLRVNREGTWITNDMFRAYNDLHQLGYAHSVEILRDGELIGGLYGLALGRVFFGESMFSLRPDASKIALFTLCRLLQERGFYMIDCQVSSEHLSSLGAIDMPRQRFITLLGENARPPDPLGPWQLPASLLPLTNQL